MLLMGQQPTVAADATLPVDGLAPAAVHMLLDTSEGEPSKDTAVLVQEQTGGNPRLIHLVLDLATPGTPLVDTLNELGNSPSIEALLDRVRRRLSDDERTLLLHLAVFRRSTPRNAWEAAINQPWQATTLQSLLDRHLGKRE